MKVRPSYLWGAWNYLVVSGLITPELEDIARLVEDAKEAIDRNDVERARVCLEMATVAGDPDQKAKYEDWMARRDAARGAGLPIFAGVA